MEILRKYRSFVITVGVLALAVVVFFYLVIKGDESRIARQEESKYALQNMGYSEYMDKIEITNWNYDNSTIYLDLYNGSDYWFKTIDIKFTHGEPPTVVVGDPGECKKGYYSSRSEKEHQFRIELDEVNLLKPKTTGQYRINAGAVLTQVQKCRELEIINAKGYEARK